MKSWIKSLVALGAFVVFWQIIAVASHSPLFSTPTQVLQAGYEWARSGALFQDFAQSLWRALAGLVFGTVIGILAGLVTGYTRAGEDYLDPILQIFRPLPPVAMIPVFILWFGIGDISKVLAIGVATFFPVWINTHGGIKDIPQTYIWTADILRIKSVTFVWRVLLPAATPYIIAGIRTGIAVAFVMVFVSELAGASSGLGYHISVYYLAYRIDQMLAGLVFLGAAGAMTDFLFVRSCTYFLPWSKLNKFNESTT